MTENLSKGRAVARAQFLPMTKSQGLPCAIVVATDDGYLFKVHTTSANNKQFNAVNDELTLGRWFKGRFVSAGLVKQVDNTAEDADRIGMITQEMLDQFGSHFLFLQRTKHFPGRHRLAT